MEQAEGGEEQESDDLLAGALTGNANLLDSALMDAAEPHAAVSQWLDATESNNQQGTMLTEADKAASEGHNLEVSQAVGADQTSPGGQSQVASLVQQYEQLGADQPASQQAPLIDFTSAVWPEAQQLEQLTSSRPRLAPLDIPDGLVLHTTAPSDRAADGRTPLGTTLDSPSITPTPLQPQPSSPTLPLATPRAQYHLVLQGAAARSQAAVAAHRARLHLNEHSTAGSAQREDAVDARHGWAAPVKKSTTPVTPRPLSTQRSSLDTGRPVSPLSRLSSPTAPSHVRKSLDTGLGSPSPKAPLRRFGSVAVPSTLDNGRLSMPGSAPRTPLRRGGSVATPQRGAYPQRHSVDMGRPESSVSGRPVSPSLARGGSVTIAQIMKQNSRLPPLDHAPVSPASPGAKSLPPLRYYSKLNWQATFEQ